MIPYFLKSFNASDGREIFYHQTPVTWDTQQVVLFIHGMSEHSGRYEAFAENLFRNNTAFYAIELRGHGATGRAFGPMGHFADDKGWQRVMDDVLELRQLIGKDHPDLPVFLFGFSMGSILARCCLIDFGHLFAGGIIGGTTLGVSAGIVALGKKIAEAEILKYGPEHPSSVLRKMTFGFYNLRYKPNRTDGDWLSSDEAEVDRYIEDEDCGFTCSSAFYRDMFNGLQRSNGIGKIAKMPKDLPVLLISGDQDTVSAKGMEVRRLYERMKLARIKNVQMTLFAGMRHHILGDVNYRDVYGVINGFIKRYSADRV